MTHYLLLNKTIRLFFFLSVFVNENQRQTHIEDLKQTSLLFIAQSFVYQYLCLLACLYRPTFSLPKLC
jgi:hypothetical protein